jgi:hypothetical protein
VRSDIGILIGIALNVYIDYGSIVIFMILILSAHEHGGVFPSSDVFFNFFLQSFNIFIVLVFHLLSEVYVYAFFEAIVNRIAFLISFSDCLLLGYRKHTDFSMLILYLAMFLELVLWGDLEKPKRTCHKHSCAQMVYRPSLAWPQPQKRGRGKMQNSCFS